MLHLLTGLLIYVAVIGGIMWLTWLWLFWRGRKSVTGPLRQMAWLYGAVLGLYVLMVVISPNHGFAGEQLGSHCVTTDRYVGARMPRLYSGHGALLSVDGNVQACVSHPSATQWLLLLLVRLPALAVWAGLVLMSWQVIRAAQRAGPFAQGVSPALRQLGSFVIIAPVVAGSVSRLSADLLTTMVVTPHPYDATGVVWDVVINGALRALFPVPALAGAAVLTFARISKVGVAMDEELKATV